MISRTYLHRLPSTAFVAAIALSQAATANVTLPGGDTTLDGAFADLRYGPSGGGSAFVTPRLFVSQFGNTLPPPAQVLGTDLSFNYSFQGLGTARFLVHYDIRNQSAADTFTDLRFILNVEPSGPGSFLDTVTQAWGAQGPFDPDAREIAPYSDNPATNLLNRAQTNNGVNNGANGCGAAQCDADFALQWNRAALAPGQTWNVDVEISDSAVAPSVQRFLRATSVDSPSTLLTVSAVPEPEAYLFFGAGLGVLLLRLRLRVRT
jgi:hypothetical protein